MKTHLLRNIFIVGSAALALAASTVVLPSVADAAAGTFTRQGAQSHPGGRMGANFRGHSGFVGRTGRGAYGGGYYGGYGGGYYPGFCGPIQLTLGLCGPWGY
jgi:uncharacterized membrane protein